jgi:glycosyltransferase involved in cell wall biosynthesis
MRKALVMTAFSRPKYLDEVLQTVKEADPKYSGYEVRVSVDPSSALPEITDVLHKYMLDEMHIDVHFNAKREGDMNARNALARAFDDGVEVALYCQDDVILSPDVFKLVDWFGKLPNRDDYLCLWTHNYESDTSRPYAVVEDRGDTALRVRKDMARFHGEAFALSATNFNRYFRENWFPSARAIMTPNKSSQGELSILLEDNPDLYALVPCLSRSTHIGRVGGGSRPSFHDRVYGNREDPISQLHAASGFTLYTRESVR